MNATKGKKIPLNSEIKHKEHYELKIAVLGKSLVGKSALTYRFINDKFPTEHDTTIEDQYRVEVSIEGFDCRLGKSYLTKKYLTRLDKMTTKQC
jgi:GTPase SAR1 family protein